MNRHEHEVQHRYNLQENSSTAWQIARSGINDFDVQNPSKSESVLPLTKEQPPRKKFTIEDFPTIDRAEGKRYRPYAYNMRALQSAVRIANDFQARVNNSENGKAIYTWTDSDDNPHEEIIAQPDVEKMKFIARWLMYTMALDGYKKQVDKFLEKNPWIKAVKKETKPQDTAILEKGKEYIFNEITVSQIYPFSEN